MLQHIPAAATHVHTPTVLCRVPAASVALSAAQPSQRPSAVTAATALGPHQAQQPISGTAAAGHQSGASGMDPCTSQPATLTHTQQQDRRARCQLLVSLPAELLGLIVQQLPGRAAQAARQACKGLRLAVDTQCYARQLTLTLDPAEEKLQGFQPYHTLEPTWIRSLHKLVVRCTPVTEPQEDTPAELDAEVAFPDQPAVPAQQQQQPQQELLQGLQQQGQQLGQQGQQQELQQQQQQLLQPQELQQQEPEQEQEQLLAMDGEQQQQQQQQQQGSYDVLQSSPLGHLAGQQQQQPEAQGSVQARQQVQVFNLFADFIQHHVVSQALDGLLKSWLSDEGARRTAYVSCMHHYRLCKARMESISFAAWRQQTCAVDELTDMCTAHLCELQELMDECISAIKTAATAGNSSAGNSGRMVPPVTSTSSSTPAAAGGDTAWMSAALPVWHKLCIAEVLCGNACMVLSAKLGQETQLLPVAVTSRPYWPQLQHLVLAQLPSIAESLVLAAYVFPHLTHLELIRSSNDQVHDQKSNIWTTLLGLKHLSTLHMQNWVFSELDQGYLCRLTQLKALHLVEADTLGVGLSCISRLTGLQDICLQSLRYEQALPDEFVGLSQLTSLTSLQYRAVGPLPSEVRALNGLQLQVFSITSHYDADLIPVLHRWLHTFSTLTHLTLSHFALDATLVKHLSAQPHLRELCVAFPALRTEGLGLDRTLSDLHADEGGPQPPQLPRLSHLEVMYADQAWENEVGLSAVMPNLQHLKLNLAGNLLGIDIWQPLVQHSMARSLFPPGWAPLEQLTHITSHGLFVTHDMLEAAPNVTNLEVTGAWLTQSTAYTLPLSLMMQRDELLLTRASLELQSACALLDTVWPGAWRMPEAASILSCDMDSTTQAVICQLLGPESSLLPHLDVDAWFFELKHSLDDDQLHALQQLPPLATLLQLEAPKQQQEAFRMPESPDQATYPPLSAEQLIDLEEQCAAVTAEYVPHSLWGYAPVSAGLQQEFASVSAPYTPSCLPHYEYQPKEFALMYELALVLNMLQQLRRVQWLGMSIPASSRGLENIPILHPQNGHPFPIPHPQVLQRPSPTLAPLPLSPLAPHPPAVPSSAQASSHGNAGQIQQNSTAGRVLDCQRIHTEVTVLCEQAMQCGSQLVKVVEQAAAYTMQHSAHRQCGPVHWVNGVLEAATAITTLCESWRGLQAMCTQQAAVAADGSTTLAQDINSSVISGNTVGMGLGAAALDSTGLTGQQVTADAAVKGDACWFEVQGNATDHDHHMQTCSPRQRHTPQEAYEEAPQQQQGQRKRQHGAWCLAEDVARFNEACAWKDSLHNTSQTPDTFWLDDVAAGLPAGPFSHRPYGFSSSTALPENLGEQGTAAVNAICSWADTARSINRTALSLLQEHSPSSSDLSTAPAAAIPPQPYTCTAVPSLHPPTSSIHSHGSADSTSGMQALQFSNYKLYAMFGQQVGLLQHLAQGVQLVMSIIASMQRVQNKEVLYQCSRDVAHLEKWLEDRLFQDVEEELMDEEDVPDEDEPELNDDQDAPEPAVQQGAPEPAVQQGAPDPAGLDGAPGHVDAPAAVHVGVADAQGDQPQPVIAEVQPALEPEHMIQPVPQPGAPDSQQIVQPVPQPGVMQAGHMEGVVGPAHGEGAAGPSHVPDALAAGAAQVPMWGDHGGNQGAGQLAGVEGQGAGQQAQGMEGQVAGQAGHGTGVAEADAALGFIVADQEQHQVDPALPNDGYVQKRAACLLKDLQDRQRKLQEQRVEWEGGSTPFLQTMRDMWQRMPPTAFKDCGGAALLQQTVLSGLCSALLKQLCAEVQASVTDQVSTDASDMCSEMQLTTQEAVYVLLGFETCPMAFHPLHILNKGSLMSWRSDAETARIHLELFRKSRIAQQVLDSSWLWAVTGWRRTLKTFCVHGMGTDQQVTYMGVLALMLLCPHLEQLILINVSELSDAAASHFSQLHGLRRLEVQGEHKLTFNGVRSIVQGAGQAGKGRALQQVVVHLTPELVKCPDIAQQQQALLRDAATAEAGPVDLVFS